MRGAQRNMGPMMLLSKRPGRAPQSPPMVKGRRPGLLTFPQRQASTDVTNTADTARAGVLPWRYR